MHQHTFHSTHRRSARRAAALIAAVTASVLLAAGPTVAAQQHTLATILPAHSRLTATSPKDGSTVKTATKVVLTLNEDVDPNFAQVKVTGPGGDATTGKPKVDGTTVTQALAPYLAAGSYTVLYRVVSADGHPVAGKTTFRTTTEATTTEAATSPPSTSSAASPTPGTATSPPASRPASPSSGTSTLAVADPDGEGPPWTLIGIGLVLALVAGAVALGLRRRSRTSTSSPDST